jgi:hypothetical protein
MLEFHPGFASSSPAPPPGGAELRPDMDMTPGENPTARTLCDGLSKMCLERSQRPFARFRLTCELTCEKKKGAGHIDTTEGAGLLVVLLLATAAARRHGEP